MSVPQCFDYSLHINSEFNMLISDLSYFESISESGCPIVGGVVLGIAADAIATGSDSLTLTSTNATIKTIANGRGAIAKGTGSALAVGYSPYADTDFYAAGFDKVKVKSRSAKGDDFAFDSIRVIAIDLPNR